MIRTATRSDAYRVMKLYNHYVEHTTASFDLKPKPYSHFARTIPRIAQRYAYYVDTEDKLIRGIAYAHPWKSRPGYNLTLETTVYIHPDHLHQGIGTQLMLTLIDQMRRQGYKTLIACITADNRPSIALHQKLGFQCASHFHNVGHKFNTWLDIVDYELQLQ